MRVILPGYEGSKSILPASSYLLSKYMPDHYFDIEFLNFGSFQESLYTGCVVSLADYQIGGSGAWSRYIREYLQSLPDEFIIFALDDYFIYEPINYSSYRMLCNIVSMDPKIVCARLCSSDFYSANEYAIYQTNHEVIILNPNVTYSATTQYCIWRTQYLIELLGMTADPWNFEIHGSEILNESGKKVIGTKYPTLVYGESSALSERWPGKVKVGALAQEDILYLVNNKHLKVEEII